MKLKKSLSTEEKTELFESMPVPKAVANLVLPTIMAMLVMMLYNLADTYFVGLMNDPSETSAVTLVSSIILAFNSVINLFGMGCSSLISRSLGVKDYDTVKKTSAFGFYGAIFAGILFSAACTVFQPQVLNIIGASAENINQTKDYMFWTVTLGAAPSILNVTMSMIVRAEGEALHASIGSMSGCILNIILDPIFILPFGFNMGAAGAGCATFISNCVACIYYIAVLLIKDEKLYISVLPKELKIDKALVFAVCSVGIPAAVQNLLNVTGSTILNSFMAEFGTEAVSAIGISHKMAMIPMYVALGTGQGVMPLIGYNFACGNRKRLKEALLYTLKFVLAMMFVSTLMYYIFAKQIILIFMKNELVVEYGTAFIRGLCLAQPFLAVDFLGVGVFQACGMGKKSLIFAILRKIVLEIPAIIILNKIYPMYGMAYSQLVAEVILSVAAVIMVKDIIDDSFKNRINRIKTAKNNN